MRCCVCNQESIYEVCGSVKCNAVLETRKRLSRQLTLIAVKALLILVASVGTIIWLLT